MKKYWWIPVLVCSLFTTACTGLSPRPKAAVYPKTRVLQCSCDAAWPELLQTVGEAGFRLVAKDDAGRIARFLYLEPQLPEVVRTGADPNNLAIASNGSGQESGKLRIESAVVELAPQDQGCEAKITVSYQGRDGVWSRNWSSLDSSGLLENKVLAGVQVTRSARAERRRLPRREPSRTAATPAVSFTPTIIGGDLARQ